MGGSTIRQLLAAFLHKNVYIFTAIRYIINNVIFQEDILSL